MSESQENLMSFAEAGDALSPTKLEALKVKGARTSEALEQQIDIVGDDFAGLQEQLDQVRQVIADRLCGVEPAVKDKEHAEGSFEPEYTNLSLDDLQAEETIILSNIAKDLRLAKDMEREAEEQEVINGERAAIESIVMS